MLSWPMTTMVQLHQKKGPVYHRSRMNRVNISVEGERSDRALVLFFFFFSSRRRHTRFDCDWSSDVCSSDLQRVGRVFENVRLAWNQLYQEPPLTELNTIAIELGAFADFPIGDQGRSMANVDRKSVV